MKRFGIVLALAYSLVTAATATAATSTSTFAYHIGDGFSPALAAPDVAEEPNGDTVTVRGTGSFDKDADSATGSGTFVHRSANGTVLGSGTWTATGLLTFQFFGCGSLHGSPRPATVCGGRLLVDVHLVGNESGSPLAADGMLTVICEVGNPPDGRIPEGMMEGIKLNVPGLSNFNEQVSGNTVFIKTAP